MSMQHDIYDVSISGINDIGFDVSPYVFVSHIQHLNNYDSYRLWR